MNKVQKEILNCYKEFKRVCDKHHLRYYAFGGTGIGAVRHHGFIPWDDDMDVMMPYEDYKKFIELSKIELKRPYEFICFENNPRYTLGFGKVHNTSTTFIESGEIGDRRRYKGVYLDVMPFMGCPHDELQKTIRKLRVLKFCDVSRRLTFKSAIHLRKGRKLPAVIGHAMFIAFPLDFFSKKRAKIMSKSDFSKKNDVLFAWRISGIGEELRTDYDTIGEGKTKLKFEDVEVPVMDKYHENLTTDYGDYMELPPKEKRVSNHDAVVIDLKKSYREYDEGTIIELAKNQK